MNRKLQAVILVISILVTNLAGGMSVFAENEELTKAVLTEETQNMDAFLKTQSTDDAVLFEGTKAEHEISDEMLSDMKKYGTPITSAGEAIGSTRENNEDIQVFSIENTDDNPMNVKAAVGKDYDLEQKVFGYAKEPIKIIALSDNTQNVDFKLSHTREVDDLVGAPGYTSSDESVVKVDSEGNLTPVGCGKAKIDINYSSIGYNEKTSIIVVVVENKATYQPEIMHSGSENGVSWTIDANGQMEIWGDGSQITKDTYYNEWIYPWDSTLESFITDVKSIHIAVTGLPTMEQLFKDKLNGRGENHHLQKIDFTGTDFSKVTSMKNCFEGNYALEQIVWPEDMDTKSLTEMEGCFYNCQKLQDLSLTGFDTSKVASFCDLFRNCLFLNTVDLSPLETDSLTNMSGMFGCELGLESVMEHLDFTGFDTSKVTNMHALFAGNMFLVDLNIADFDTSNVVDMGTMFGRCSCLEELDVSHFNTSNVVYMDHMFEYAESLEELDVTNFDTSNVTTMYGMFRYVKALKELDLSNFDTSNVTDFAFMFEYDQSLESLDVSGFHTPQARYMSGMFHMCTKIKELDLSNFVTDKVIYFNAMFSYCQKLEVLDVSNFDTSSGFWFIDMFNQCKSLKVLDVSGFDTSNANFMGDMFRDCENIEELDVSNFDTSNCYDYIDEYQSAWCGITGMFCGMKKVKALDVSNFDTTGLLWLTAMFSFCENLETIDISSWDTSSTEQMTELFMGCKKLKNVNISGLDLSCVTIMKHTFEDCASLEYVDISNLDVPLVQNLDNWFTNCTSLKTVKADGVFAETILAGSAYKMFEGCVNLEEIIGIEDWYWGLLENTGYMFTGCKKLSMTINLTYQPVGYDSSSPDEDSDYYDLYSWIFGGAAVEEGTRIQINYGKGCSREFAEALQNRYYYQGIVSGGEVTVPSNITIAEMPVAPGVVTEVPTETDGSKVKYGGKSRGIVWSINENGLLTVSGEGELEYYFGSGSFTVSEALPKCPWEEYKDEITALKLDAKEMVLASYLFYDLQNLKTVDLSEWDTSKVAYADCMFKFTGIQSMDLSNKEFPRLCFARQLLCDCSNLESVNLSGMKAPRLRSMESFLRFFSKGSRLTEVDFGDLHIPMVTNMSGWFFGCGALTNVNFEGMQTGKLKSLQSMFYGCYSIDSENMQKIVNRLDVSQVQTMQTMFAYCSGLTTLDLSKWDVGNVENFNNMFESCGQLQSLNLSGWDTTHGQMFAAMFRYCSSLKEIKGYEDWDVYNAVDFNSTFDGCGMDKLDLSNWDCPYVQDMRYMFQDYEGVIIFKLPNNHVNIDHLFGTRLNATAKIIIVRDDLYEDPWTMLYSYENLKDAHLVNYSEWGDVDGNGNLNALDALLILKSLAGLIDFNNGKPYYWNQQTRADVNADGNLGATDALLVLKKIAGLVEKFEY